MKAGNDLPPAGVASKIALFDAWIAANTRVDPASQRKRASAKPPAPAPADLPYTLDVVFQAESPLMPAGDSPGASGETGAAVSPSAGDRDPGGAAADSVPPYADINFAAPPASAAAIAPPAADHDLGGSAAAETLPPYADINLDAPPANGAAIAPPGADHDLGGSAAAEALPPYADLSVVAPPATGAAIAPSAGDRDLGGSAAAETLPPYADVNLDAPPASGGAIAPPAADHDLGGSAAAETLPPYADLSVVAPPATGAAIAPSVADHDLGGSAADSVPPYADVNVDAPPASGAAFSPYGVPASDDDPPVGAEDSAIVPAASAGASSAYIETESNAARPVVAAGPRAAAATSLYTESAAAPATSATAPNTGASPADAASPPTEPVENSDDPDATIDPTERARRLAMREHQESLARIDPVTGLAAKPLGAHYAGEERGEGWQQGRKLRDVPARTEYYGDEQRARATVAFTDKGQVKDGDGNKLRGARGFVLDPKTADVLQFKQEMSERDGFANATHHSSPLAGGDVAAAGNITVKSGRIVDIDDQSGHYKPGAEFTFQAVRQMNIATLTDQVRARLTRTRSTMRESGQAEGPDTLEQLIAAEVQVERELFFAAIDEESGEKHRAAALIEDQAEQDKAFEAIAAARHDAVNAFRDTARKIEAAIRAGAGDAVNPLRDPSEDWGFELPTSGEAFRRLAGMQQVVDDAIDSALRQDPGADVKQLRDLAARIERASRDRAGTAENTQATVSLLGKTGMLDEAEYAKVIAGSRAKLASLDPRAYQAKSDEVTAQRDAMQRDNPAEYNALTGVAARIAGERARTEGRPPPEPDEIDAMLTRILVQRSFQQELWNRASALKQLVAPLGEAAYAALVKSQGVADALAKHGLVAGVPGQIDKLKAVLGQDEIARIEGDDQAIAELSEKFGVQKITKSASMGPVVSGFEIGKATSMTLKAEQFLQTGGNEAQIRTKARMLTELRQKPPDAGAPSGEPDDGANAIDVLMREMRENPALSEPARAFDLALSEDLLLETQGKLRRLAKQPADEATAAKIAEAQAAAAALEVKIAALSANQAESAT